MRRNPSRRERLANWGIRNRWAFATNVACIILTLMAVTMLYPLIIERLKKPIETLPSFQSAIDGIDEEEYEQAVELLLPTRDRLSSIRTSEPSSCLRP